MNNAFISMSVWQFLCFAALFVILGVIVIIIAGKASDKLEKTQAKLKI